jgi:hypothetical protein
MRMRSLAPVAVLLGLGAITTAVVVACVDEPHRRTPPGKNFGGGGGACEAKTGELPKADCDNSEKTCTGGGCKIDEARCGSTSTCLPTADNGDKNVLNFRIRRLNLAAPAALASDFIQNTVVNAGMDLKDECGEDGKGLFNWLIQIDKSTNTMITGGAPPAHDPLGQGFCFASFQLGGTTIQSVSSKIEFTGENTFRSTDKVVLNIPIFLSDALSSAIILPLRDARLENVTMSSDGRGTNCIGSFNPTALDSTCSEDRALCPRWQTAGALGGYITLEDADGVKIADLANKSLCAFLASDPGLTCNRDAQGKIIYQGDYCSTTTSPGGCLDSVWLSATFAASAAPIFDGHGIVDGCSGATASVPDAGASTDASTDASADAQ